MKLENLVAYDARLDVWTNGIALARLMQVECKKHERAGYFLDFGMGETASYARYSPRFETDCGHTMEQARNLAKAVRVFRNMNGQIGASLWLDTSCPKR